MKAKVIISPLDHPHLNLGLEEYFMKYDALDEPILFFYVNRPSIILGRNQNPWLECDLTLMKNDGVVLARRITGGGTVYHDYGNLNYSFVYKPHQINESEIFDFLVQSLSNLGFKAQVGKRKELLLGDLKISGTAFGRYRDRVVQHGTLLVDTNLLNLKKYLKGIDTIATTKSVLSVPSLVVNLKEVQKDMDIGSVIDGFASQIESANDCVDDRKIYQVMETEIFKRIQDKNQSWRWLFAETPPFEITNPLDPKDVLRLYKGRLTLENHKVLTEIKKTMPYIHFSLLNNEKDDKEEQNANRFI